MNGKGYSNHITFHVRICGVRVCEVPVSPTWQLNSLLLIGNDHNSLVSFTAEGFGAHPFLYGTQNETSIKSQDRRYLLYSKQKGKWPSATRKGKLPSHILHYTLLVKRQWSLVLYGAWPMWETYHIPYYITKNNIIHMIQQIWQLILYILYIR